MKKSTLTIAAFAAMLTAGVLFSCSKDAEKTEGQTETPAKQQLLKIETACAMWMAKTPDGQRDTCLPYYWALLPGDRPLQKLCDITIGDPDCYEFEMTLSMDNLSGGQPIKRLIVQDFPSLSPAYAATFAQVALEGYIYVKNGISIVDSAAAAWFGTDFIDEGQYLAYRDGDDLYIQL